MYYLVSNNIIVGISNDIKLLKSIDIDDSEILLDSEYYKRYNLIEDIVNNKKYSSNSESNTIK